MGGTTSHCIHGAEIINYCQECRDSFSRLQPKIDAQDDLRAKLAAAEASLAKVTAEVKYLRAHRAWFVVRYEAAEDGDDTDSLEWRDDHPEPLPPDGCAP